MWLCQTNQTQEEVSHIRCILQPINRVNTLIKNFLTNEIDPKASIEKALNQVTNYNLSYLSQSVFFCKNRNFFTFDRFFQPYLVQYFSLTTI